MRNGGGAPRGLAGVMWLGNQLVVTKVGAGASPRKGRARVQTFSIVTVCRNDAEALVPTIRSIGTQVFSSFQYVIQDGGSSDHTEAVIRGFGDWVDVYRSEPDGGIYQAMNRALEACTGKYTLFINAADMLFAPDTLAEMAAKLRADDDVVTGVSIALETGKPHPFRAPDRYWTGMTFDHQAAFIRTDLLRRHPHDETLRISGDYDVFCRMRLAGAKFRAVEQPICRKPYSTGVSESFIGRFRERFTIALRHFGERFPVEETLKGELIEYISRRFDATHLSDRMKGMTVADLLALHDELGRITAKVQKAAR